MDFLEPSKSIDNSNYSNNTNSSFSSNGDNTSENILTSKPSQKYILGTRESQLAMIQAVLVRGLLNDLLPELEFEILGIRPFIPSFNRHSPTQQPTNNRYSTD